MVLMGFVQWLRFRWWWVVWFLGSLDGELLGIPLLVSGWVISSELLWIDTCAMARYSIGIDTALIPRSTKIATFVEAPLIKAMKSGPASLQNRSIRRIRALRAVLTVSLESR